MRFGGHVSSAGGLHTAVDRAAAIGCESIQIFTQSPRMWRPTAHDPRNVERFKERVVEAGITDVVCHALYLVNLASPDDAIYQKSVATMRATLEVACAIEADGVIFHVGSHLGAGFEAALERVVPALREIVELCNEKTWLLMENSAGTGATIGRAVSELAAIFEALDRHERLGLCLDSCHLYASGYDITDPAALDTLLDEVDAMVGIDRLRALHINDSQAPLGSNRDRHDNIGAGLLGEGLGLLLGNPRLQSLPALLEVPGPAGHGPDAEQIRLVRELHERATRGGRKPGTSGGSPAARRTRG